METIIFSQRDNPELALETYKLRHKIFCEKMAWFPTNPDGIEKDNYDDLDRTLYVVIRDRLRIVALVRLIVGSPSLTEELAGEKFINENHLCISRADFAKGYHTVHVALLMAFAAFQIGAQHHVDYFIGCTYQDFVDQQVPIPLPFPIWLKKDIDGFPSIFYKAKTKALWYFLHLLGVV